MEEALAVGAGVFDAAEPLGEVGTIFECFELGLGVRIVIGDVRPAVGLGDLQIDQQGGHGLAAHAGAAIGVEGERARRDVLCGHRLGDQVFGQLCGFTQGEHPAHHIAAEDIEDHVQVIAGPLGGSLEFRDIPAPNLVGLHRQQFRFGIRRMDALMAPLARTARGRQQAVHGPDRAHVATVIEQLRVDGAWGAVGKTVAIEHLAQGLPLGLAEGEWRPGPRRGEPRRTQSAAASILAIDPGPVDT
ncbi:MAG: hypothetical protein KGO23_02385 [Nitrospirota bacterium]|nr:hypothetical protein [Nitrospirota bacterium]